MDKLKTFVTTQLVIKNSEGEILLLKRNKPGGWFTLPGGTVLEREAVEEACAREVEEEIGIKVKVGKLVRIWQSNHIGSSLLGVVFYAKDIIPKNTKINLTKEHNKYGWFRFDNLMKDETVDPYIKGQYLNKS